MTELILIDDNIYHEDLEDSNATDLIEIIGGSESQTNRADSNLIIQQKDDVISKLIPDEITECALSSNSTETCSTPSTVSKIGTIINVKSSDPTVIMETAKGKLNCETERCVLTTLVSELGENVVKKEINTNLKVIGPTDSKLLSNINIDNQMKQWAGVFKDFFPYNFNMLNYASYSYKNGYVYEKPDTLATIQFGDLYLGTFNGIKFRCAGCVINSDIYQRGGKHWMALFVDARSSTVTIEFFNSSGNNPAPEWVNWMEKTKLQLEQIFKDEKINDDKKSKLDRKVELIKVSNIRHQQSKTECGLYSLFYIWARLNKIPHNYFNSNPIHDQFLFEFRQHIFEDPTRKRLKRFNWSEYATNVKLEWE